jgi:hypothetical protein
MDVKFRAGSWFTERRTINSTITWHRIRKDKFKLRDRKVVEKAVVTYYITMAFVQDGLRETKEASAGNPWAW